LKEGKSVERSDDIDLATLWRTLCAYKFVVTAATLICGLLAVVLAFTATPIYRAELTITQAHEEGLGGSGTLSQLSGLASLAGVNLGGSAGPQRDSQAVLRSNHLIEEFIRRNNLLPILFRDSKKPPTLWLGVKKFKSGVLDIREDARQGVTIVAVDWRDPAIAARWANGVVALANELLRARALDESARDIAYLKDQVTRTDVVDLRRVMYDLIASETKKLMLANGRLEYAFTVVDPAVTPEIRTSPKRGIMVLVGLITGFLIGTAIAFILRKAARGGAPAIATHPPGA
jgi:uncharacterized protein involved in exopolysaccharide biosynthesis